MIGVHRTSLTFSHMIHMGVIVTIKFCIIIIWAIFVSAKTYNKAVSRLWVDINLKIMISQPLEGSGKKLIWKLNKAIICSPASQKLCLSAVWCCVGSIQWIYESFSTDNGCLLWQKMMLMRAVKVKQSSSVKTKTRHLDTEQSFKRAKS